MTYMYLFKSFSRNIYLSFQFLLSPITFINLNLFILINIFLNDINSFSIDTGSLVFYCRAHSYPPMAILKPSKYCGSFFKFFYIF